MCASKATCRNYSRYMLKKKINAEEASAFKKMIDNCKNVVIVSHSSPDGDAIGSSLGMKEYLERKGKNVTLVMPNYFPDFLRWMNDADKILNYERQRSTANTYIYASDLIICLDFNQASRIGDVADVVLKQTRAKKILIDHHIGPDKFADLTISRPEASSTCELVFRVLTACGEIDRLNLHGAEDLYAGMCTDTGSFTYNSKDPDVFIIIAELLRKGIDKDIIYRRLFNNYTEDRYRLMGHILSEKLMVFADTHSSIFSVTREELNRFHYLKGDTEGIVNMPLTIRGQKLSISLREDTEKPIIWVSARSYDDIPCNKICAEFFNGGGHHNASGGKLENVTMEEAIEIAKRAIESYRDMLA